MNVSFLLQGVLIFGGAVLVWPLFPRGWRGLRSGWSRRPGLASRSSGLRRRTPRRRGTISERRRTYSSAMGARRSSAWRYCAKSGRRALSGVSLCAFGLIGLAGLAGLAVRDDFGLGAGGIERIAAYPFPLWLAGMGAWLLRAAKRGRDRTAAGQATASPGPSIAGRAARRRCSAPRGRAPRAALALCRWFRIVLRRSCATRPPLPRISRAWRVPIPLARSCASRRRRAAALSSSRTGVRFRAGGSGDELLFGGGEEPGLQFHRIIPGTPLIRPPPVSSAIHARMFFYFNLVAAQWTAPKRPGASMCAEPRSSPANGSRDQVLVSLAHFLGERFLGQELVAGVDDLRHLAGFISTSPRSSRPDCRIRCRARREPLSRPVTSISAAFEKRIPKLRIGGEDLVTQRDVIVRPAEAPPPAGPVAHFPPPGASCRENSCKMWIAPSTQGPAQPLLSLVNTVIVRSCSGTTAVREM